ncbi:MAG: type III polyketide synthase [Salibacteraceae bacterium]
MFQKRLYKYVPVYINNIATANPDHKYDLEEIATFLKQSAINETAKRKVNIIAKKSGINHRYSVIDDFRLPQNPVLFNGVSPLVEKRMRVYQLHAMPLALKALKKLKFQADEITHIITVSCTGMSSPGLELQLTKALDLNPDCTKLAVNFIGCHGVFHALKHAKSFVDQDRSAKVLIVSVELCSIHYQPSDDDDSILANVLFGDGSAACIVSGEPTMGSVLRIDGFKQHYLPDQSEMMAWNIHSSGFLLKLSAYVPKAIFQGIGFLFNLNEENAKTWAIHPGGKNIIDAVEKGLKLNDEQTLASRETLAEVGNLSSASILFVLHKLMQQNRKEETLCALGFGPGLTIEKMNGELLYSP